MKINKLNILSGLFILLRDRSRSTTREDIRRNNDQLIDSIHKYFPKMSKDLLMYLYNYIYNYSEFLDTQYITYNEKTNGFTIFTAYPLKDGLPSYDYVKLSTSKDPSIPINKDEVHISLDGRYQDFAVKRSVSLLLPEDIELVRLESEQQMVHPTSMKKLIALGRKLPPSKVLYRNLSDLGIVTVASATSPFHKTVSLFSQTPEDIERIEPEREIEFNEIPRESKEFWRRRFAIKQEKDRPYFTTKLLEEMTEYQQEKFRSVKKDLDDVDTDILNRTKYESKKDYLDDAVVDFINNFGSKDEVMGGLEEFDIFDELDEENHRRNNK